MKVEQMKSPATGKPVRANQFIITTDKGRYFQSYQTIIAFIPADNGSIQLDRENWNISPTTSKYRNVFIGLTTKETERKIKAGEILLTNLN